jgi:signal transduction histidine kinase
MKKIYLITILFCLVASPSLAQQKVIDSLELLLNTKIPDTTYAKTLIKMAMEYEGIDTSKSAMYYQKAISFSVKKNLTYEAGSSYYNQSFLLNTKGLYDKSLISLDSAEYYFTNSNNSNSEFKLAQIYTTKAEVFRYKNDYNKAVEYQQKGIKIFEKLNKPKSIVPSILSLSNYYKEMNEFGKMEQYIAKALAIARVNGYSDDLFKAYFYMTLALNMQNKYQEAKNYLDSAKQYYTESGGYGVPVSFHLVAGLLYMNLNMLDSANKSFKASYAIAEKYKAVFSMIQSRLQLGRVLSLQKRFKEAETILLSAAEEIKKTNESSQWLIALDYLSRLYDEWGNYKMGLQYYKEFKEVSDSVSSDRNKNYASELEVKYETEKKDNQILLQQAEIQKKKTFNYVLTGGAVALLIISLLSYRNYRHKQKIQQQRIAELETQQHLTATEAVLKGEEQERTRLAKDLHDGLGGMLSGIKYSMNNMKGNLIMTPDNAQAFERSMDMLDSSIKEMRRVAHNMMPESLVKFGLDTALKDFCNEINQSGALKVNYQSIGMENAEMEQTTAITIYRIVQELINNTMKHAAARTAIVQVTKSNNQLSVTVEDDGKGFDPALLKSAKGIGWTNIQSRIDFLKGTLDVQSSADTGTSVHIELKA